MLNLNVFLGAAGGVGTTTAVLEFLKKNSHAKPLVIDLDLHHGDIAQRLVPQATSSLAQLACISPENLDETVVSSIIWQSKDCTVIPSPSSHEIADLITGTMIDALISNIPGGGGVSKLVVVDAGSRIDSVTWSVICRAEKVTIVARADEKCAVQITGLIDLLVRSRLQIGISLVMPFESLRKCRKWGVSNNFSEFLAQGGRSWKRTLIPA